MYLQTPTGAHFRRRDLKYDFARKSKKSGVKITGAKEGLKIIPPFSSLSSFLFNSPFQHEFSTTA
jgi:hypothetical protein